MSGSRKRGRRSDQTRRGEHKKHLSPETAKWNAEHLLPEQPGWMTTETYHRLAQLRAGL
jgi:hypothetical protein